MTGSIIASLFFVISFLALYAESYGMKKSDKKLNGTVWLVLTLLTVMCWETLLAGLVDIINIPINIWSVGIMNLLSAVALAVYRYKKKERQQYYWEVYDGIYALCAIAGAVITFAMVQTPNLDITFVNSDAAVHLKNAVLLVKNCHLPVMYMAPLQSALLIEVAMPFIAAASYYKVFMILDILLFAVEAMFFMILIRDFLKTKVQKGIGLVMLLLYTLGWPLMSYLLSFYYWALGVMLVSFVMLLIRYYKNKELNQNYLIFLLMITCNAVTMCYMIFGPFAFIAAFIGLIVYRDKRIKLISKTNIWMAVKVFLVPTILAVYYCYFQFLQKEQMSAGEVMTIDGGIYKEYYIDFIWLMPFVLYMLIRIIMRKKKIGEDMIFFLCFLVAAAVGTILAIQGKLSSYYYFKLYFPMWQIGFVMSAQVVVEWMERQIETLISYVLIFIFLAGMCYGGLEAKLIYGGSGLEYADRTSQFFEIYRYNQNTWSNIKISYPQEYLDACNYVMTELKDEELVPVITIQNNYANCYWYEAITGQDCSDYYGWKYGDDEIWEKLDNCDVNYFVIYIDSLVYERNKAYYDSFERVFENDRVMVCSTKNRLAIEDAK